MKSRIDQIIKKTYRYWWIDGMADLAMGVFFLVLSAYNYLIYQLEPGQTSQVILAIAQPVVFILCWFGYGKFMKWVKERVTYRRTGYVAYQPKTRKNRLWRAVLGAVIGAGMALMVSFVGPEILKIDSSIIVGTALALVSIFLASFYGANRLYLVAAAQFGLGFWASRLPLDADMRSLSLMTAIGVVWALSGLITFLVYIKTTEPIDEEGV